MHGYRGKVAERERAREPRAASWTLQEIATELGVARSSVSSWVRDGEFTPRPRSTARRHGPNVLQRRKAAEIVELRQEGRRRVGVLCDRDLLVAGAALYAGEGVKRDGCVSFTNSDPRMVQLFCTWLRRTFEVDEQRVRLYLHDGLDLDGAARFWSTITGVPPEQFTRPHRAVADPTIRRTEHEMGCVSVRYGCSRTHRAVMGLVDALLECPLVIPG